MCMCMCFFFVVVMTVAAAVNVVVVMVIDVGCRSRSRSRSSERFSKVDGIIVLLNLSVRLEANAAGATVVSTGELVVCGEVVSVEGVDGEEPVLALAAVCRALDAGTVKVAKLVALGALDHGDGISAAVGLEAAAAPVLLHG